MTRKSDKIKTCIIPCAGKGLRWRPMSEFLPKQMLPIGSLPIMDYVVRETVDSGCNNIIVILNPTNKIIAPYLKNHFPEANFSFISQNDGTRGVAEVVLMSRKYIGENPFVLFFPDIPGFYDGKPPLKNLIEEYQKRRLTCHAYAFSPWPEFNRLFSEYELQKRHDGIFDIVHKCPMPDVDGKFHHPGNSLMNTGRIIYTPEIFPIFEQCLKEGKGKEVSEIPVLTRAIEKGEKFVAVPVNGYFFDTGIPEGYYQAIKRLDELGKLL